MKTYVLVSLDLFNEIKQALHSASYCDHDDCADLSKRLESGECEGDTQNFNEVLKLASELTKDQT